MAVQPRKVANADDAKKAAPESKTKDLKTTATDADGATKEAVTSVKPAGGGKPVAEQEDTAAPQQQPATSVIPEPDPKGVTGGVPSYENRRLAPNENPDAGPNGDADSDPYRSEFDDKSIPTLIREDQVAGLANGTKFFGAFVHDPKSDDMWQVRQSWDSLMSGKLIRRGVSNTDYWNYSSIRPPLCEKTEGRGYRVLG